MKSTTFGLSAAFLLAAALPGGGAARAADTALAAKAHAILETHCFRCHGQEGKAKGGFGYVLEPARMIAQAKIVPGKAAESELYQRTARGEMPPAGQKPRPSAAELALLAQWIDAGAPAVAGSGPRAPLPENAVLRLILTDLQSIDERQRRFARYLTLTHLYNAGRADAELVACRQATAKLVNSLSFHPRIAVPHAIDPAQTVLRIDLRDYKWNARTWERILAVYPYRVTRNSPEAKACAAATGTELPILRADWFVATASRAPLYHDILQLPGSDRELERLLRVEVLNDIEEGSVIRSGFNGSGVSRNNRLLERHDAAHGAYWRSYDFSDNTGRQNLFEHPLGPLAGGNSFEPAGGEIIFHLPNGLQGYLLVDRNGRRVDRAPVEIVSDPKRPDRTVETGLSCMSCHARGLIPKADQVRAHVEKNPRAFTAADLAAVRTIYPSEARFRALLDEDNERYLKALTRTGAHTAESDPVMETALRYEATLDLAAAAAEAGLPPEEFTTRLGHSPELARILGPLKGKGGTVQRDVFLASFPDMARELRLGDVGRVDNPSYSSPRPFTGHTGTILSIAISTDGRLALSGSDDRTLRLWDTATGRELRRFEGHTDEVLAVALAPDGQRALSGSADRSVRLWDVASGKELHRLMGHTDKVRCVAFASDGKFVVSGSQDRTIRLWDVAGGNLMRTLEGHSGWIASVALAPDGRRIASGSYDHMVRLWETASGRELARLEGHTREVYSVAFAADGRRLLSGGNDRTMRLWDADTGKELQRFEGHVNSVIAVGFAAGGQQVLSGSSQYRQADRTLRVWDAATGRELRGQGGAEADRVGSVAFALDGRWALTGNPEDKTLRRWKLAE